ncbi:MAG: hypothetical protein HY721_33750, partial [Planctomycetes bacterium]|nr:hypothetical protein [Planctomycetota bacterium]
DEVSLRLPAAAVSSAVVLGDGVKEVVADAAGSRKLVRFARPWLGTRQLRVEYEVPHEPGSAVPVPSVDLAPGAAGGAFGGERFLVLQSRGPVEVVLEAGPGLAPADPDELPDFAEAWSEGRVIAAYRFRASGDPGTLRTTVHERAPVLESLARELRLTTVVGLDGTSRTRAEVLLASAKLQRLVLRLPGDARAIAADLDGEPLRAVRPGPGGEVAVPLPPRSHVTVGVVYERAAARPLGPVGSWSEAAPEVVDVPVGETRWTVHHPDGYRFAVAGRDLRAADAGDEEGPATFAANVIAKILQGEAPLLTAFAREAPRGALAQVPPLSEEELRASAAVAARSAAAAAGRLLEARDAASRQKAAGAAGAVAPRYRLLPEGRSLTATKLGGGARLELSFRSLRWSGFARRMVFLATLLAGWALAALAGGRAFFRAVLGALLLAATVPVLAAWRSPLLAVPFCEGLAALLAAGAVVAAVSRARRARARRGRRAGAASGAAAIAAIATIATTAALMACAVLAPAARADEAAPAPQAPAQAPQPTQPAQLALTPPFSSSGVLLPYDPAKGLPPGEDSRVFVPDPVFRELWRLAHPEIEPPEPEPPRDLVLGNAAYRLRLEGPGSARVEGSIAFLVLTDRWTALPLPFEGARVVRVALDGVEAGLGTRPGEGPAAPAPFVELKGRGAHRLDVELAVPVRSDGEASRVACALLGGAGTTLRAELPAGARVASPHAVLVREEAGSTAVVADLGGAGALDLAWTAPRAEAPSSSQVESLSYSLLTVTSEGYVVERTERLRVTGRPASAVEHRVLGDWAVTEVAGPDVADWSLSGGAEPGGARLRIAFSRPVSETEIAVRGRARLAGGRAQVAGLALAGAAREEAYFGLRHAAARRFAADSLAGMARAPLEDLSKAFPGRAEPAPDRLHRSHSSGEGESIAAEAVAGEAAVTTDLVAIVLEDRLAVTARSRYAVTGPGPLRHEVRLPEGWTARDVRSELSRSWETAGVGPDRRLVVQLRARASSGTEVVWSAEGPLAALGAIEVPAFPVLAAAGTALRETTALLVAASGGLEVSVADAGRLAPADLASAPRWLELPSGADYRLAFRAARAEAASTLRLAAARRPSQLAAAIVHLARVAEDAVHVNARAVHRIRLGARDRFRLRLPAGAQLVALEARNQRSREVRESPQGTEVEVVLQAPAAGEYSVDLSYRLDRRGEAIPALEPVQALDGASRLEDVDAYVAVLETSAGLVATREARGLVPVEASVLPHVPEGVAPSSLRPVHRALRLDWSLLLEERPVEIAPGPAAIVPLVEIETTVGDDGTARSRAVYTVRNRSLQHLLLALPERTTLWGVTLNGRAVAVGSAPAPGGARGLRVPVEHVGEARLDLEVALVYEERRLELPALRGTAALAAPRVLDDPVLPVQVLETVWNLHFPSGYAVARSGGNARHVPPSVQYSKRVESLLGQLERVSKAARDSDSRVQRDQAERELARLELALGDNVAELEASSRGPAQAEAERGVAREELEGQRARDGAILSAARKAQEALRQARSEREKAKDATAPPSRREQGFLDAAGHQRRAWRDNRPRPAAPAAAAAQAQREGLRLDDLLETGPAEGPPALSAPPQDAGLAAPAAVNAARGLKPLPEALEAPAAPGAEAPEREAGTAPHAFVHQGGEARVEITFTRDDALPRAAAGAVLGLAAIVLAWRMRRASGRSFSRERSPSAG